MKVIIKGEMHASSVDKEDFLSHISREEVDAVFHEGREDHVSKQEQSFGYVLFVSSAVLMFWVMDKLSRHQSLEERIEVPYHADIDWPLPDTYDTLPRRLKVGAALPCVAMAGVGLYAPRFGLPFVTGETLALTIIMRPILVVGAVVLFSGILIIYEQLYMSGRDERMARSIDAKSREEDYEIVGALVGDAHRAGIAESLREKGWKVETYEANPSVPVI